MLAFLEDTDAECKRIIATGPARCRSDNGCGAADIADQLVVKPGRRCLSCETKLADPYLTVKDPCWPACRTCSMADGIAGWRIGVGPAVLEPR
jgi:hypothetical protein